MPIDIGWLVEGRISYFRYIGDITAEELTLAAQIGLEFLNETDATLLHTVQDNAETTSFPLKLGAVTQIVKESLTHPKMGWMISVSIQSDIIRFVAGIVTKMTNTRSRIFNDLGEAKDFLNYVDTTLIELSNISAPQQVLYRIEDNRIINIDYHHTEG